MNNFLSESCGNYDLTIDGYSDLSSKFEDNFIEFKIGTKADFNGRVVKLLNDEELKSRQNLSLYLEKSEFKEEMLSDPEWWERCSRERKKRLLLDCDLLTLPYRELAQLRVTIFQCLKEYLNMYKRDYRGIYPNYFHSWAVICKSLKDSDVPHIHHYNPLNIAGVYYVGGNFKDGNGMLEIYSPDKSRANIKRSYEPKEGNLLLFPAHIPHGIGIFDGKNPRTSIAFDIWFKR